MDWVDKKSMTHFRDYAGQSGKPSTFFYLLLIYYIDVIFRIATGIKEWASSQRRSKRTIADVLTQKCQTTAAARQESVAGNRTPGAFRPLYDKESHMLDGIGLLFFRSKKYLYAAAYKYFVHASMTHPKKLYLLVQAYNINMVLYKSPTKNLHFLAVTY